MILKTVDRQALTVIGLQIRTRPMSPEIPALWPAFVARIPEIGGASEPGVSYGVMSHDSGVLEYTAAVAASSQQIPPGMVAIELPAATYAYFAFPLSGLAQGFGDIFNRHLPASGHVQLPGPYFERYNEAFDPDNAASLVEIFLPVAARK
jgi:AraC family transcriptional regulator